MSFFGGGFTQIPGLQGYLDKLQAEQYGPYTQAAGTKGVNRSAKQVFNQGQDIFGTSFGAGVLAGNNNQANNELAQENQNINSSGFGTMGGTYTDRLKDQNYLKNRKNLLEANDASRQGLMNSLAEIAGQNADRKNLYTNNQANFNLNRDQGAIQGKIGGNQYHQGIGGQLLGGLLQGGLGAATGGLSSAFSGGFGGGYRNNSSFDYNGAPHFS